MEERTGGREVMLCPQDYCRNPKDIRQIGQYHICERCGWTDLPIFYIIMKMKDLKEDDDEGED